MLPLLDDSDRADVVRVSHGCVRTDKVAYSTSTDPDTRIAYAFIITGAGGGMVTVTCKTNGHITGRATRFPEDVPSYINSVVQLVNSRAAAAA